MGNTGKYMEDRCFERARMRKGDRGKETGPCLLVKVMGKIRGENWHLVCVVSNRNEFKQRAQASVS